MCVQYVHDYMCIALNPEVTRKCHKAVIETSLNGQSGVLAGFFKGFQLYAISNAYDASERNPWVSEGLPELQKAADILCYMSLQ